MVRSIFSSEAAHYTRVLKSDENGLLLPFSYGSVCADEISVFTVRNVN